MRMPTCVHNFRLSCVWFTGRVLAVVLAVLIATTSFLARSDEEGSSEADSSLTTITTEASPAIRDVIVKGAHPQIIYVPIVHDGPYNHLSNTPLDDVEKILKNCGIIAAYLYDKHDVQNVLLEGMSPKAAAHYNGLEDGKKVRFRSRMKTWQAWEQILNSRDWHAFSESETKRQGALTSLGQQTSRRIVAAMERAKKNGWFRSREAFNENQSAFQKLMAEAIEGYNDKHDEVVKNDPGLKKEFAVTVSQRNKAFIDNILSAEQPGILFCGKAHTHDLLAQIDAKGVDYMVIVPAGVDWPVKKKSDKEIYEDMLKFGCQLKNIRLKFGDGFEAKVTLPIR